MTADCEAGEGVLLQDRGDGTGVYQCSECGETYGGLV